MTFHFTEVFFNTDVVPSKRKGKILEVTNAGRPGEASAEEEGNRERAACFGMRTWLWLQGAIKSHWLV